MVDVYENHMLKDSFTVSTGLENSTVPAVDIMPGITDRLQYPFLIHGTLAVAAAHDRYLNIGETPRRSVRESYHWSQCTRLFSKWLSHPIKEEYKDPLWAACGMLGVLTFASMNSPRPEESWPLGPPDSSDLEWVRLGAGKTALWHLVNPLRPGSAFQHMSETFVSMRKPLPAKGTGNVSTDLIQLCGLKDSSTAENNPYYAVVHCLSDLLPLSKHEISYGEIMMITMHMHHEFGTCLEKKDPVALLLLCLWYAKGRHNKWWIDSRARYEIPAICTYLQRFHGDNTTLQALIPWDEVAATVQC